MPYYAAIDIGSNAARLLIKRLEIDKETGKPQLTKEMLLRYPLRLGFDVFAEGKITEEREKAMISLMKAYRNIMNVYCVTRYRACATSAMRDSANGKKIIKRIKKKADIQIEIIDGQEEARMVYNNHFECLADRTGNYMYVDVGGGSTEVNLLVDGKLIYTHSFNIGTIRLLTGGVREDAWQRMREEIEARTSELGTINIIGSGGNINKYFKLADHKDKDNNCLSIKQLRVTYDKLACMTKEERMKLMNLKPDRADVIEPAGRIFLTLAEVLHSEYVYIPMIGISDGIIDDLVAQDYGKM